MWSLLGPFGPFFTFWFLECTNAKCTSTSTLAMTTAAITSTATNAACTTVITTAVTITYDNFIAPTIHTAIRGRHRMTFML